MNNFNFDNYFDGVVCGSNGGFFFATLVNFFISSKYDNIDNNDFLPIFNEMISQNLIRRMLEIIALCKNEVRVFTKFPYRDINSNHTRHCFSNKLRLLFVI
jgi:hypothetical protein